MEAGGFNGSFAALIIAPANAVSDSTLARCSREGIRVSARFCVARLHSFKYRRYDTTLAGGVSHRMAEKQTIQARRAGTSCLCRPAGPLAAVSFANGGLHRRLGLCRPSGPKIALLQYLRIELA